MVLNLRMLFLMVVFNRPDNLVYNNELRRLIIKLFASGFDEKSINLSVEILKILFIGFIFSNLASSVTVILNALYFS